MSEVRTIRKSPAAPNGAPVAMRPAMIWRRREATVSPVRNEASLRVTHRGIGLPGCLGISAT
jgi:hypothetical protein